MRRALPFLICLASLFAARVEARLPKSISLFNRVECSTIKRSYDEAGNQVTLTDRNGKKWQFQFDAANRLTNTITPLGRETRVTYDQRGLVSTVREPSTQTITNFYDAKGRLTMRTVHANQSGNGATIFNAGAASRF